MNNQDKPLEHMTVEDIQQFILHLKKDRRLTAGTINNYISAVKFFYTYVLEKTWNPIKIPRMRRKQNLPVIPSKREVLAFIDRTENIKHKAVFMLIYGSGLRVSEVARLRISDICSKTMSVRVDDAKHNTNRYTILSETALDVLREYFRTHFPFTTYNRDDWLFPGRNTVEHVNVKTIKNAFLRQKDKLGITTNISAHTLRHCFATHSLECGYEIKHISEMLGHKRMDTTKHYLHMTSKSLMGIKSPLDIEEGKTV